MQSINLCEPCGTKFSTKELYIDHTRQEHPELLDEVLENISKPINPQSEASTSTPALRRRENRCANKSGHRQPRIRWLITKSLAISDLFPFHRYVFLLRLRLVMSFNFGWFPSIWMSSFLSIPASTLSNFISFCFQFDFFPFILATWRFISWPAEFVDDHLCSTLHVWLVQFCCVSRPDLRYRTWMEFLFMSQPRVVV